MTTKKAKFESIEIAAEVPEVADALSGTVLDERYLRQRFLGRGAQATMFLAEQLETNHPVAVKVLSSRFRHDREEIKRFQTGEKAYRGWELTLDEMLPSKAEIEAKISPACKCTSRLFPRLVPRR